MQATNKVNRKLDDLASQYGFLRVDYFAGSNQWRIWFPHFHQHHDIGMYGDLTAYGTSIEDAIQRMEASVVKEPPVAGRCAKGCPKYSDDLC